MESLKIILFAVLAAVTYGVLHDQITAHVCVEYFTVGHPPVFQTQSPFLLAIGWGIIATWWVGLPLGIGLAAASRIGAAPKLRLTDLRSRIALMMLATGILALVAGFIGAWLAGQRLFLLSEPLASAVPLDRHVRFLFDASMHDASYGIGTLLGVGLIVETVWRRLRQPVQR